jgi:hypothetical protein
MPSNPGETRSAADGGSRQLGPPPSGWKLGQLSSKYETGGRGPRTTSTGIGDAGGVSYGSYQMTSKPAGGTVQRFLVDPVTTSWHSRFKNRVPGTREFTAAWHDAADTTPFAFQAAQHDYIKSTHYDPLAAAARRLGVDVSNRSAALQDVVWSTSVQNGPMSPVIRRAIKAVHAIHGNLDDDASLIRAIYAERGRKNAHGSMVYFHRNSISIQKGVANRFVHEERDALAMLSAQKHVVAPTPARSPPMSPSGKPGASLAPVSAPYRLP